MMETFFFKGDIIPSHFMKIPLVFLYILGFTSLNNNNND